MEHNTTPAWATKAAKKQLVNEVAPLVEMLDERIGNDDDMSHVANQIAESLGLDAEDVGVQGKIFATALSILADQYHR